MLQLKSIGLGTAIVGSTLAVVSFVAAPAQAALVGGISLSGESTIVDNPAGANFPTTSTINFLDVDIDSATFDFLDVSEPPDITINSLLLTQVSGSSYSTPGQVPWINFGTQTIGSVTAGLTFNLDAATFTRIASGGGASVFEFADPRITGTFVFDGETIGRGFVSASRSFGASSYQVSIEAVPEPFTMLGAGAAAGLGAYFKRQAGRKQGKDNKKA